MHAKEPTQGPLTSVKLSQVKAGCKATRITAVKHCTSCTQNNTASLCGMLQATHVIQNNLSLWQLVS